MLGSFLAAAPSDPKSFSSVGFLVVVLLVLIFIGRGKS